MSFIRIETPPYPNTINLILEDPIPETFSPFHEIIKILETFEDLENTVIVLSINLVGFDDTKYSHHFKVNYTKMFKPEIVLQLFKNLSIALDNTQDGECLNQSFSISSGESDVTSSLKWVYTGPECEFLDKPNKIKVKKLMSLSEQLNKLFHIKNSTLSDEATITCSDDGYKEEFNLSLSYIFKYGLTFYHKFGYRFDYNHFKDRKIENDYINSHEDYFILIENIRNIKLNTLKLPPKSELLDLFEKEFVDFVMGLFKKDIPLYDFMTFILKLNCYYYIEMLDILKTNNNTLKNQIETLIKDAGGSYHKTY